MCESPALSDWRPDFLQLERGAGAVSLQRISSDRAALQKLSVESRVLQLAGAPRELVTLGLVTSAGNFRWNSRNINQNYLFIFSAGDQFESTSQRAFCGHTMSFSRQYLCDLAQLHGSTIAVDKLGQTEQAVPIAPVEAARLASLLGAIESDPTAVDSLQLFHHELPIALLDILETHTSNAIRPDLSAGNRALAVAREFLHENAKEPFDIETLARSANCNVRTLQRAFRKHLDTTPRGFLNALRLQAVRTALLNSRNQASISELATEYGFTHLGRFSANYKAQYGELPRQSLAAKSRTFHRAPKLIPTANCQRARSE